MAIYYFKLLNQHSGLYDLITQIIESSKPINFTSKQFDDHLGITINFDSDTDKEIFKEAMQKQGLGFSLSAGY